MSNQLRPRAEPQLVLSAGAIAAIAMSPLLLGLLIYAFVQLRNRRGGGGGGGYGFRR